MKQFRLTVLLLVLLGTSLFAERLAWDHPGAGWFEVSLDLGSWVNVGLPLDPVLGPTTYTYPLLQYPIGEAHDAAVRACTTAEGCSDPATLRFALSAPSVDCVVSEWSGWTPMSDWSTCTDGMQVRTEQRTRSILTPAANGGATCPVLVEYREITQSCSVTPPPDTTPPIIYSVVVNRNGNSANYTITVNTSDDDAVYSVRMMLDKVFVAELYAQPYTVVVRIKQAGTHTLVTIVTDRSGNVATDTRIIIR